MIPEELEKLIIRHKSEGHLPFFVNCTTGTTVYGAFDPINPIADICERHHIWLHIDVSSTVPVLFSKLSFRGTYKDVLSCVLFWFRMKL